MLESHLTKLTKALNTYNPIHSNQNTELTPKYETSEIDLLASEQQQLIIHPTAEERQSYYDLVSHLENPRFVESLNLAELKRMDEMQLISETLRMVIISRAIELYNHGAINENIFLSGTPGYPQ